jgi:hypothetical protein
VLGGIGGGTPGTPGTALLDPVDSIVGGLANGLNHGLLGDLGLGNVLAPVAGLTDSLTDTVDGLLAPVLGSTFTPNSPNILDPVDGVVDQVTDGVAACSAR